MILSKFHMINLTAILTAVFYISCNNSSATEQTGDMGNKIAPIAISDVTGLKGTDDECCSQPGQARECWDDDKALDNVVTCENNGDCMSGTCDPTSHLCTCTSSADCENNGACSDSGLCGPSWCNGYMICSCWGGCEWWSADKNYTPKDWATDKGLYCCEGDYPSGPNAAGDTISGYLSNNPLCGKNCNNNSDCNYLDGNCTEGVCDAGGTCVPSYMSAGTNCGDDYPSLECRNHDVCNGSGNCVPNYVNAGISCTNIDGVFNTTDPASPNPYYPPSCYTGYCGAVTVDLNNFTNDFSTNGNGRCEPGITVAENDTCNTLLSGGTVDTSNTGYLGTFDATAPEFTGGNTAACKASAGCLTTSASLLCSTSNYSAGGDDCDSAGSGNPDLTYAFRYQTNANNQQELYGYVIQVEADFNVAIYVVQDVDDCPANGEVNSNRCLQSYAGNTSAQEIKVNTLGNSVPAYDQGCCDPSTSGATCGYKWCTRGAWTYPTDPVPCRDDDLNGTTTCSAYTSYASGNMASAVIHPLGLNADTTTQEYKNVLVFVDSADGTTGNFTITVERRKWDAGPIERINDDPRAYDITDVDEDGSIYLGNFKNSVNSQHSIGAGGSTCGGYDCLAGWDGKSGCHTGGSATQYWPNVEYFKIHLQNDSDNSTHYTQKYCLYTDKNITNSAGELVIDVLSRNTNGPDKTISPIFASTNGPPYKEISCDYNTKNGDAQISFTATEDVLYLIGVSQRSSAATGPCTGSCNYKLTVKKGACETTSTPEPPTCSNSMLSPVGYSMPTEMAGGFKLGSPSTPGYSKSSGQITQSDGNSLYHQGLHDLSNDDTWLLEHIANSFTNFTILVIDPPGGEDWSPWFELYGCNFNLGIEFFTQTGTGRGYFDNHLNPAGIADPYPGQSLNWAVITRTYDETINDPFFGPIDSWPMLAGIECNRNDCTDTSLNYEYEIYAIWD